jgi:hypothetical protein
MVTAGQPRCPVHPLTREYNPLVAPQIDDPLPIWARARAEAPVFQSEALGGWVVSRYADVVDVLRDAVSFSPGVERKMFGPPCPEAARILAELPPLGEVKAHSAEPPVHTKLRRYLQPAFSPRRIAAQEPVFRELAEDLVDRFETRGGGEFYHDYAYRFPLQVVARFVGLPEDDYERVREWAAQQQELRYSTPDAETQIIAAKGQRDAFAYTLDLVARRRAEPTDDLLSWIIQDSDSSDDPLTEEQLASQVTSLLTAGHETSAHFLVMLVRRLLTDRSQWEKLVADPSTAASLVEEGLRTDGPVQTLWRRTKVDVEIGGQPIAAGSRVALIVGSANLDDSTFEQPGTYRPGRPDLGRHVAFGRGIHTCVGAGVARLESKVTLEVLASRLPRLRIAADDEPLFLPSATQRMAQRLMLEWT